MSEDTPTYGNDLFCGGKAHLEASVRGFSLSKEVGCGEKLGHPGRCEAEVVFGTLNLRLTVQWAPPGPPRPAPTPEPPPARPGPWAPSGGSA